MTEMSLKNAEKIFRPVVDFLFYQECIFCHEPNTLLCQPCIAAFPRSKGKCFVCEKRNPFFRYCSSCRKDFLPDLMIAPFAYSKKMKKIVQMMKFEDISILADSFSNTLADLLRKVVDQPIVVPIPLSKERFKYRGYNQSRWIAESLCQKTGWKIIELLNRKPTDFSQVEVDSKAARKKNIKGVFSVNKISIPEEVVLLDDVITTGSTMEEACRTLKKAGARRVIAVALAMG